MSYLLSLFLVLPAPSFSACSSICGGSARVRSFDGFSCRCHAATKAERWCDSCVATCGPVGVRACSYRAHFFGHDRSECACAVGLLR
jgi:hypothetical protein